MSPLTPERWRQAQQILDIFDELPPEERSGFLEETRRQDPKLGRHVAALLANDDQLDTFLETPLFPICCEHLDDAILVPRIGSYKLQKELGQGGMGVVYLAIQEEPFRRRVALKLIQPGKYGPDTVRRFHNERQILARIRHPNVAQLYDGGTTRDGRPYFVMELIEGEPIEEYCDARQLPTRQCLELFLQVCSAVHLAHQKLRIVHRDLKAGNILVTPDGIAKLLDFGIARPVDSASQRAGATPSSVFTPFYSSPEQLAGRPLTTTSDVYSLGVLLYRLLTGRLPYRLETCEPQAMQRLIEEQELTPPSAAVREEAGRQGSPRRLDRDLDAIILKALARNPDHRYSSVEALVADIRRYFAGLPVHARRPTLLYRAGKLVRRHRLGLASAVVIVSLTLGLIFEQTEEIARARRVASSMVDLLIALQPMTPDQRVPIADALDKAASIVHDPMFAEPRLQTLLMDALGRAYMHLDRYEKAGPLLEDALDLRRGVLGEDHLLVAESQHNLAFLYQRTGAVGEAERHLREALRIRYASADRDLGELSESINNLAITLYDQGYYAEAEAHFLRVLGIRQTLHDEDHPSVNRARSNLATAQAEQGRYAAAEALHRRNLELRIHLHGPEHEDVAASRNQLAMVLYAMGEHREARAEAREALRLWREIYGPGHRRVALALNNLGMIQQAEGALEEAEETFREALRLFREQLASEDGDHLDVAKTKRNLAAALCARGQPRDGLELAQQAIQTLNEKMVSGSWPIAQAESVHGGCLAALGRFAEAEEKLLTSFAIIRDARGASTYTRDAARRLVELYEAWEKPERAEVFRHSASSDAASVGREGS